MATEQSEDVKRGSRQLDHVKHGSAQHAAILQLRKANKDDGLQLDGWTLLDPTAYGTAASETFLKEILRQKVAQLQSGPPTIPANAPEMWVPTEERQ